MPKGAHGRGTRGAQTWLEKSATQQYELHAGGTPSRRKERIESKLQLRVKTWRRGGLEKLDSSISSKEVADP